MIEKIEVDVPSIVSTVGIPYANEMITTTKTSNQANKHNQCNESAPTEYNKQHTPHTNWV